MYGGSKFGSKIMLISLSSLSYAAKCPPLCISRTDLGRTFQYHSHIAILVKKSAIPYDKRTGFLMFAGSKPQSLLYARRSLSQASPWELTASLYSAAR